MSETTTGDSSTSQDSLSVDRFHAGVQRVVGGGFNLLRECARISSCIDDSISAERAVKRVQFWSYELQSRTAMTLRSEAKLEILNRFFFDEIGFQCSDVVQSVDDCAPEGGAFGTRRLPAEPLKNEVILGEADASADAGLEYGDATRHFTSLEMLHLGQVIQSRCGAASPLAVLYHFLAERIDVELSFVDLRPTRFLRHQIGADDIDSNEPVRSVFIDLFRSGRSITSDDLFKIIGQKMQSPRRGLLERHSFEDYLAQFIEDMRRTSEIASDINKNLFLLNTLIAYRPSQVTLLAQRALLHFECGNSKLALQDLKRYFSFHDIAKAPASVRELYVALKNS